MIFEEDIEAYRIALQRKRYELQRKGELTNVKRHKLTGAELILATILSRQPIRHFYKLMMLDMDGRLCTSQNTKQLKQMLTESPLQVSEKPTTT